MRTLKATSIISFTAFLAACTTYTPIANLTLPPVQTINGKVSSIQNDSFTITDKSGNIQVSAPSRTELLHENEEVTIYGNLNANRTLFDAYEIRKANNEKIIIVKPNNHLGFVVQSF